MCTLLPLQYSVTPPVYSVKHFRAQDKTGCKELTSPLLHFYCNLQPEGTMSHYSALI